MRRVTVVSLLALWLSACGSSGSGDAPALASSQHAGGGGQGGGSGGAALVGFNGYGALHFGMNRWVAEQAMDDHFAGSQGQGACQELMRADDPRITYLFLNGTLQRIDVESPGATAQGGGRVGQEIDDIRQLYAGKLLEDARSAIPGGHSLRVLGPGGGGIVFQTDGNGSVTAFRAANAAALDRAQGCGP